MRSKDVFLGIEIGNGSVGFDFFLMNPLDRVLFHVMYSLSFSKLENNQFAHISSNPTMAQAWFPFSITYHIDNTEEKCSAGFDSDKYRGL